MAALHVDGTLHFEGKIVEWDIDYYGSPDTWTLGEMFFIYCEETILRETGTAVAKFQRQYVNKFHCVNNGNRIEFTHKEKLYNSVQTDAPNWLKDLYKHCMNGDMYLRETLKQYQNCLEPAIKMDVVIKRGPHRGKHGFIVQIIPQAFSRYYEQHLPRDMPTPILGPRYKIQLNETGEHIETGFYNLQIPSPRQNLMGTFWACSVCLNVVIVLETFLG